MLVSKSSLLIWLFLFLVYYLKASFGKKLLSLLTLEILLLLMIYNLFLYFSTEMFPLLMMFLMMIMMVLDSVLALSIMLLESSNTSRYSFFKESEF